MTSAWKDEGQREWKFEMWLIPATRQITFQNLNDGTSFNNSLETCTSKWTNDEYIVKLSRYSDESRKLILNKDKAAVFVLSYYCFFDSANLYSLFYFSLCRWFSTQRVYGLRITGYFSCITEEHWQCDKASPHNHKIKM